MSSHLEAPDVGEELAVANNAHDGAMRGEQEVIEADCRLGRIGVAVRVLCLYGRGVEERCRGDCVHAEAKDVKRGEVYCEAKR